ncbi:MULTISPECIES: helix-turn-helix domain-containing protein [Pseudoalteromonas]|jgi:predicted DNA-binding protein (UPF0251 family)|nr:MULTISPECIES: helix-turn-helix domain-containing protein [Pseudoalteromonas]EWH05762.1 hypothetical protein AT00_14080 [Pseudoalteromonas lipolytica SCSIO 04301]MBE0352851.1 hypothetical protein [Pseudoalteromonas lipolytica LMEB 39]MCC9660263.1 hypothetical protein [Pseudoalteromonas sp. MB41]QMW16198.1 hypothetical protein H3302_18070 [Pseudoalteromonas sp. MT33b]SFT51505.1 helix-turn-helix, Psq domain [Pseudoalteromonas lipolytica]|tara:strand:+ start:2349 stop:2579 length:231 start_codon:yes stop_codon:yes gene_type:complete
MLNNDPEFIEALQKVSVHHLTITEAAEQYDIPKRTLYNAVRQQHAKLNKQKAYLIATQKRLKQHLRNVEMELARFV